MSTSELNYVENPTEGVLTSNMDSTESCKTDFKEITEELKIKNLDTANLEQCISLNSAESASDVINSNVDLINNSNVIFENDFINLDIAAEITQITSPDSTDEIMCLKNINTEVEQIENSATKTLTEDTIETAMHDSEVSMAIVEDNSDSLDNVTMPKIDAIKMLSTEVKNPAAVVEIIHTVNSLSCLAVEYASSESDQEEEEERIPSPCEEITIIDDHDYIGQNKTQYRTKSISDNSDGNTDSDSESSCSSDTSDDSSDDDSENDSEFENSADVSKARPSKFKQTKSEFDDLPPIEELKITVPEELCDRLGEISGIVEQLVIVRPIPGKPTLNLDSILFLEKGHKVLGQVFDVFGQVAEPNYCIRFNSEEHIKQSGITLGMEVYYSPNTEHTSLVFLHELVKLKGVDVSGDDDTEPPEFSDDEEERAYNQLQKQKQRQKPGTNTNQNNSNAEVVPQKRQCHEWSYNPWSNDWRSQHYNNSQPNRNFGQGPPRWNHENTQPPFQNSFNLQNPAHPSNQTLLNQYNQSTTFNTRQYQFNPYNTPFQQNNVFPSPNSEYAFGQPPGFQPNFNSYGSNLYRPNFYPHPPMSWTPSPPPPPPPPPPSSM